MAWLSALFRRAAPPPAIPAQPDAPELGGDTAPAPSSARTALDYRLDAARHVYACNATRIYRGPLPPLLHAIGVLDVQIDAHGRVQRLDWLRAPRHAPEVVREIERTARAAAPYPAPLHLDGVTWTDTWLWDASGCFQLDTLTEGQLGGDEDGAEAGGDGD